jgi:hypothetical protein
VTRKPNDSEAKRLGQQAPAGVGQGLGVRPEARFRGSGLARVTAEGASEGAVARLGPTHAGLLATERHRLRCNGETGLVIPN